MMSVQLATNRTAILASEMVTNINGVAPKCQLMTITPSLTFHRLPVFISVASCTLTSARARTENLIPMISIERIMAKLTNQMGGRIALRPTISTAILGIFCSICDNLIRVIADGANLSLLRVFHVLIIPQNEPKYCAVILQRLTDLGLTPQLATI